MEVNKDYLSGIVDAERRFLESPVKIIESESENDKGFIEGRAIKFNSETVIAGLFREVIRPGAADVFLESDVRCLFNHDPNLILARSVKGKGTLQLKVSEDGLDYRYKTPNRTYAIDLEDAIQRGDVNQSSFGFTVKKEKWTEERGKLPLREIFEFDKGFDVSPVTFPAYPDSSVGKRSLEAFKLETTRNIDVTIDETKEQSQKLLNIREAQLVINKSKNVQ